jgi:hypothetical protein
MGSRNYVASYNHTMTALKLGFRPRWANSSGFI